jgi:hypothetical protein
MIYAPSSDIAEIRLTFNHRGLKTCREDVGTSLRYIVNVMNHTIYSLR